MKISRASHAARAYRMLGNVHSMAEVTKGHAGAEVASWRHVGMFIHFNVIFQSCLQCNFIVNNREALRSK